MVTPTLLPNRSVFYNGMYLPGVFPRFRQDPQMALEYIRTFQSRPSDILVCGSMKSGNHWIFEIISMLTSGKLEYSKYNVVNSHIDLVDKDDLEKRHDPRVLSTHASYSLIPEKHRKEKYKIVFILRNPKDRYVSLYNFFIGKAEAFPLDWHWSSFYEDYVLNPENEQYGGLFKFTKEWEKEMSSPNIHVVYYEDLKRHFTTTVKELAEFLEVKRDKSYYHDMENLCSFANMKDNTKDETVQFNIEGQISLFRKGEIGDWKNYFTVSQNEQFDNRYRKEMDGSKLSFTYD